jgi:hypothetical protein
MRPSFKALRRVKGVLAVFMATLSIGGWAGSFSMLGESEASVPVIR